MDRIRIGHAKTLGLKIVRSHLHNIRKILTCSASNSFVQILSESSNGDEDVLYSMYAAKRGLESIIIDYGWTTGAFRTCLTQNRIDSIRIFSDTIHIKQKSITLRLVTEQIEMRSELYHFINLTCHPIRWL